MIYAAIIVNFAIFLIHVFVGGPAIARPMLAATDLKTVAKLTNYYCWHLVSIVLFAMGLCWIWFLADPAAREVAILATGFSVAFLVWGLVLVVWKRQRHLEMPQWILFAASAAVSIGALG
ncbi:MAG TPA: hypothetical protein ENI69_05310 [Rhodospirillales bacterium]|nr:hypothetical protein [Rhodospirillales bacterium]